MLRQTVMMRRRGMTVFIILFPTIILLLYRYLSAPRHPPPYKYPEMDLNTILSFKNTNSTQNCGNLFKDIRQSHHNDDPSSSPKFVLSESYEEIAIPFHQKLAQVRRDLNFPGLEANVGDLAQQAMVYHHLAKQEFVSTICEVGFNAGHSTVQWLSGKPTNKLYSFDDGKHKYSRPMAQHFMDAFPGRFSISWGDSKYTIANFILANEELRCDIISIDGGKHGDSTKFDIEHFRWMANPHHHLVLLNDHPTAVLPSVGQAWREEQKLGGVRDLFTCSFLPGAYRGFTVGQYCIETRCSPPSQLQNAAKNARKKL